MNENNASKHVAFVDSWNISRRQVLQGIASFAAVGSAVGQQLAPALGKTVYLSFILHGNMCYDRYTKQEIRDKFPRIYAAGVRAFARHPEVTAHIDFPGLTVLSLKHYAPWFLKEIKPLIDRGQIVMAGCQYAASHAMCSDEESDLVSSRVSIEIMRRELAPDCSAFFTQEFPFHPQLPYIMNQIGVRQLLVMPKSWQRPRRVRGIDGSSLIAYPVDEIEVGKLEEYYDSHEDGSFVMCAGDFEQLSTVEGYVEEIRRLAAKGKIIRWTTINRYEKEVGIRGEIQAPHPVGGNREEDQEPSPSFSRWTVHPEDIIWHGHAVKALDAIRAAGFAHAAGMAHGLKWVNVPLAQSWTTVPENPWDSHFEEVNEYSETEPRYLTGGTDSTLLSRAWHHLLIGLNSDSAGWFPWSPRTRHRSIVLDTSNALSNEVLDRFSQQVAVRIRKPELACASYVLALNPTRARSVDLHLDVERPLALVSADGSSLGGGVIFHEGKWTSVARVDLPSYGYRLLGLRDCSPEPAKSWRPGNTIAFDGRQAGLDANRLTVSEGQQQVRVSVAHFTLKDPSGASADQQVTPDFANATTRVRETVLGPDLEILTELGWAVWLHLVIGLRAKRVEVTANLYLDLPRRIGEGQYKPEGLLLEFKGKPGRAYYDIPYATIEHTNPERSFVAAQRFAAIEGDAGSFSLVALGGNQSFQITAREGVLAANLGASIIGRADTRPQCIMLPNGFAKNEISSAGDPFFASYEHRFALLFLPAVETALAAEELRASPPVFRVNPGGGDWPVQKSLIDLNAPTGRVTAFRVNGGTPSIVLNDISGKSSHIVHGGKSLELPAFAVRTFPVSS
jgi:hypothetical protein